MTRSTSRTTHTSHTARPRFATAALLAASVMLCAGPAFAQQQVQNGNALDANQQVGSGGSNRVENQVDYAQRNLLVTGNVGGGRAFQDTVGYTAAGGFQDALGSDSLFNFRRDSVFSSPQALGVQPGGVGGNVIITRNTTSVPSYLGGAPLGSASAHSLYDSRSGTVSFQQNTGGLVIIQGASNINQLHSLGNIRTQDGALASLNASTLNGIQVNPLQAEPFGLAPLPEAAQPIPDDLAPDFDALNLNNPYLRGDRPGGFDADNADDAMFDSNNTSSNGRFAPSIMLGNMMQRDLANQTINGGSNAREGSLDQLNNFIFGPEQPQTNPDQPPQAPANPYEAILAEIHDRAMGNAGEEGGDGPMIERSPWTDILENPDEAVLDAVNRAKDDAIRRSLGLVNENGEVDREAELPEIDADSELGQLIEGLNYNLPRVETLSGEDKAQRHNDMLIRAEQDLAAGRYLASENLYRQVLRESQDNPLARAGLIHAQLGGGMIRSAAFNLRALFSEHPELIALRYDEELLPSAERLRWLQRELTDMINDDAHGAEPGLILAYLGYQLEHQTLIQYGLGIAQERTPRDPLLPVLDRIWLERDAGGDADDDE